MSLYPSLLMRMQNCGLDLSNVLLVTDRGYSSILNIQKQINCNLRFLTGIRLSEDSIKMMIDKYKETLTSPAFIGPLGINAKTVEPEHWSSTTEGYQINYKVYLHLYHDRMLSAQQDTSFMKNVNKLLNDKNNNYSSNIDLANKYGKYIMYNKHSKQWVNNSCIKSINYL